MRKGALLIFLSVGLALHVKSQDYCDWYFGSGWVTVLDSNTTLRSSLLNDSNIFVPAWDTCKYCVHWYIDLHCKDTSFYLVSVFPVVIDGDTVIGAGTMDSEHGHFLADSINHKLTLWFNDEPDRKLEYRLIDIGTKETNKKILLSSNGDYRTHLLLVRINTSR